jgi:hypothetical protein
MQLLVLANAYLDPVEEAVLVTVQMARHAMSINTAVHSLWSTEADAVNVVTTVVVAQTLGEHGVTNIANAPVAERAVG